MAKKTNAAGVLTSEEFMKNSVPAPKFVAVTERLMRKQSRQLVDPVRLKRDRAWSILGHQVIGAEVL